MNKKYFFFDIDGTLTDNATHKIVPSALETLHHLEANGHFVAIATGRAHYKAVSFSNSIDIHNLVCSGGGCLVIDDKIVDNVALPKEKVKELIANCDKNGLGWLVSTQDDDSVTMRDYRFLLTAGRRCELTSYIYDPDLDLSDKNVYKMYIALTKEQEQANPWVNLIGYLRMFDTYVIIQYDKKKDGIIRMMKHLQGDLKDVVVFGDDMNDLVMFDKTWFSIAMGNGKEALKAKADYVTDTNVNDGIMKSCKKYGWI